MSVKECASESLKSWVSFENSPILVWCVRWLEFCNMPQWTIQFVPIGLKSYLALD